MKNVIILLSFLAFLNLYQNLLCQESDTTIKHVVTYVKDEMTGQEFFLSKSKLLCSKDGKSGFTIHPDWKKSETDDKKFRYFGLSVVSVGIGNCIENAELIFLFEDGTKESLLSWNKFNCKGSSWFDLDGSANILKLLNKPIKKIRLTNGSTNDSYTYELKENQKSYFMDAFLTFRKQQFVIQSKVE